MLVNNVIDSLIKLVKLGTNEGVQPLGLPTVDYSGYVVVAGEIETVSNYFNHYRVEGYVFKAVPLTAGADYSFEFLGKTIEDAKLGSISFERKAEFLVKDSQSTGLGCGLKVNFKAEIIIGDEPITSVIKEVHVDVNKEELVIEDSTSGVSTSKNAKNQKGCVS